MMESPLDVLSRAASMVETSSRNEANLLRASSPSDDYSHRPGKELPTKLTKHSRAKDRQEVSSILDTDRDRSNRLAAIKKSASTQTQFSSFPHDNNNLVPVPPPPYFTTHDTILSNGTPTSSLAHLHHGYTNGRDLSLPPPPPPPPLPPPPPFSLSLSLSSSSSTLSSPSSSSTSSQSTLTSPSLSYPSNTNGTSHAAMFPTSSSSSVVSSSSAASRHSYQSYSATSTTSSVMSSSNMLQATTIPALPSRDVAMSPSCPKALPPYYPKGTPPPPPQYKDLARPRVDLQDTPLNLSISNEGGAISALALPPPSLLSSSSSSSSSSTKSSVPSSINCSSPSTQKSLTKHKTSWIQRNGNTQETVAAEDEAIEEHFRRSLGQKYVEASPSKCKNGNDTSSSSIVPPSPFDKSSTTTTQTTDAKGVHITGSVDDHFARALGDQMWTAIKARSEPPTPESCPGTVDAHFAKALGASMWRKLQQADAEVIDPSDHHQSPKHPPTSASPVRTQLAL